MRDVGEELERRAREREIPKKRLYSSKSYRHYGKEKFKLPRIVVSVSIPQDETDLWETVELYAKQERTTPSAIVRKALRLYIEKHKEGNPQTSLFPRSTGLNNPMLESRKDRLDWLLELITANPGTPMMKMAARFAEESGARIETVKGYLQTLDQSQAIRLVNGRLYPVKRIDPTAGQDTGQVRRE